MPPRFLWFMPFSGLWSSHLLEHRLANALASEGKQVLAVGCSGILDSYCPVMTAERLTIASPDSEKRRSCKGCRRNSVLTKNGAIYDHIDIDGLVTSSDLDRVNEVLAGVSNDNWMDLEFEGVAIGRFATYLAMLHHKLPLVTSSDAAWSEYKSDLRNSLLVLVAIPKAIEYFRPTHAVVYNPLYPTNRAFTELSIRSGCQLVALSASSFIPRRYESADVYHHIKASQTATDSKSFAQSMNDPCSSVEVREVGAHLAELIGANDPWVYSTKPNRMTPAEIRSQLGLRKTSQVIVVLLSSPDETRSSMLVDAEYFRANPTEYSDIAEFVREASKLACSMTDVDFIFRLHPRLQPNKREKVVSPDLHPILLALDGLPANAVINQASDGLSLYDVMVIADAAVNQSSSAGLEFLALGVPVVQYDTKRNNAYPGSFGSEVPRLDQNEFEQQVRKVLVSGWSLEYSRRAFRWFAATLLRAPLHLGDFPESVDNIGQLQSSGPLIGQSRSLRRALRPLVPMKLRETVSRALSTRNRAAELKSLGSDLRWSTEWMARIEATQGESPVWEPLMFKRSPGYEDDEASEVRTELRRLIGILNLQNLSGAGVLRSLSESD